MLNDAMFLQLRRVMARDGTLTIVTDNSRYAHFLAEQLAEMRVPADDIGVLESVSNGHLTLANESSVGGHAAICATEAGLADSESWLEKGAGGSAAAAGPSACATGAASTAGGKTSHATDGNTDATAAAAKPDAQGRVFAFHSMAASESRFMQQHAVVGGERVLLPLRVLLVLSV
jgi:hypothetical protein